MGAALQEASASPGMLALSRLLVCLYFLNGVYDSWGAWSAMQQPDMAERARRWPQHYPAVG